MLPGQERPKRGAEHGGVLTAAQFTGRVHGELGYADIDGGDPQLERAIEEAMRLIKEQPYRAPRKPRYPDRSGY